MGSKERREREREELRQSILAAARRIAAEEGWQALTMRKVADLIEYSPPTIYEYFESKEAILYTLMLDGFQLLYERVRAAYEAADDPQEKLLRVSAAYCDFAWEHTDLHHVMHGTSGAYCHTERMPPALPLLAQTMMATVRSALGATENDPRDLHAALDIYRSILHGVVTLALEGSLPGGRERAKELVSRAVLDWRAAWLNGR